jgi:hypothetical protein
MSTALKFASASMAALPGGIRFVLVNDRVPRSDANCALCCKKIEPGYIRDLRSRLVYCNPQCFSGHQKMTMHAALQRYHSPEFGLGRHMPRKSALSSHCHRSI